MLNSTIEDSGGENGHTIPLTHSDAVHSKQDLISKSEVKNTLASKVVVSNEMNQVVLDCSRSNQNLQKACKELNKVRVVESRSLLKNESKDTQRDTPMLTKKQHKPSKSKGRINLEARKVRGRRQESTQNSPSSSHSLYSGTQSERYTEPMKMTRNRESRCRHCNHKKAQVKQE